MPSPRSTGGGRRKAQPEPPHNGALTAMGPIAAYLATHVEGGSEDVHAAAIALRDAFDALRQENGGTAPVPAEADHELLCRRLDEHGPEVSS